MGKSENGPDLQDCSLFAREMEDQQSCSVSVLLECVGLIGGCGWRIHVLSVERGTFLEGNGWSVASVLMWPSRRHKTFDAALYCALVEHDAEISRMHFQRTLDLR